MFPDDLRYSREHEWVRVDGEQATIGITSFAADELGDIVFVETPEAGATISQFASFGVVESVKAVSDLYAPISGEVIEVNEALRDTPELLNTATLRRWLDRQGEAVRSDRAGRAARRRRLRRADRRLMAYSPHTEADHRRMLDAVGVASIEDLFADIPAAGAGRQLRPAAPLTEQEVRAELSRLAGRNRIPRDQLPGRRRLPATWFRRW